MKYALVAGLTLLISLLFIKQTSKKEEGSFKRTLYSQIEIHELLKEFSPQIIVKNTKPDTQISKHDAKNTVYVIVIDHKAYWVSENVFYTADATEGNVNPATAQPIDTNNMSKKDINKMLFILDSLKNRNNNDSGGTRN